MKPFISTTYHSYVDYAFSILLFTSPWTLGFVHVGGGSLFVPLFFGWVTLVMTIFTDYKSSLIRQFPLQMHLIMDMFAGFLIMVSPWLYDFSSKVFWPHLLFGAYLFLQAIFTKHSPFTTPAHHSVADGELNSTDATEGRLTT